MRRLGGALVLLMLAAACGGGGSKPGADPTASAPPTLHGTAAYLADVAGIGPPFGFSRRADLSVARRVCTELASRGFTYEEEVHLIGVYVKAFRRDAGTGSISASESDTVIRSAVVNTCPTERGLLPP